MPEQGQAVGRSLVWLCVKFAALAPVCLAGWLLVLPFYAWGLAHVTGFVLRTGLGYPILQVLVTSGGVLNTGTRIEFLVGDMVRTMPDVGHLTTNLAPFIALTLATTGLTIGRRLRVLLIGTPIILLSHLVTIVLRFVAGRSPFPTAVGFVAVTLPFLLWIVLAYWDKVTALFEDRDG